MAPDARNGKAPQRQVQVAAMTWLGLGAFFLSISPVQAAVVTFTMGFNAQGQITPPLVVGDTLKILYDAAKYNVATMPDMYSWHACAFKKPGKPTLIPMMPGSPRPPPRGGHHPNKGHHGPLKGHHPQKGHRKPRSSMGRTLLQLAAPKPLSVFTMNLTSVGYIYVGSSKWTADCSTNGVRAIFYVAGSAHPPESPPAPTNAPIKQFQFTVANVTDSPDCVTKTYPVVNGAMPGPMIRVTSGDTIVVTVINKQVEPVTIHWHGLRQMGTPWMDGNAFGAQCPIEPGQNYTYKFSTVNHVGTFWWHGHIGLLRESVFGALIVDPATPQPLPPVVNDRVIILSDWFHRPREEILHGLEMNGSPFIPLGNPNSLLINGRSRTDCNKHTTACTLKGRCLPCSTARCKPLTTLTVTRGKTYRLRLINAGLYGNVNFFIQGHVLTVVEADGELLKPITYTSLDILPGQAYSILISASQPADNYWIVVNGRFDNTGTNPGLAVLHYDQFPPGEPRAGPPPMPSQTNDNTFSPQQAYSFRSLHTFPFLKNFNVNRRLLLRWGIHETDGYISYGINGVCHVDSRMPMMYADYLSIPNVFDLNVMPSVGPMLPTGPKYSTCKRASGAIDVQKDAGVEIVFQSHSPPGLQHPWHLHGYNFWVVGRGQGQFNGNSDRKNYNLVDPPLRNTVTVYQDEWVAVLFTADNPGMHHLHCHLEPHSHLGMQTFLRVQGKLPPPPNNYIKTCLIRNVTKPKPTIITSPPPPKNPGGAGGDQVVDWSFGSKDVFRITSGSSIIWKFSVTDESVHALSPQFGEDAGPAVYALTDALLKSIPDQSGISLFMAGAPPNKDGLGLNFNAPSLQKLGFVKAIRFTRPGTYKFTCPLHWLQMTTTVTVV